MLPSLRGLLRGLGGALVAVLLMLVAASLAAAETPPPSVARLVARGNVGVALDIVDATQMDIEDPTGGPFYEVRIHSNHAWTLYALGDSDQATLMSWPTASRNFVIPLRGLGSDASSNASTPDIYQRYYFAVTSR